MHPKPEFSEPYDSKPREYLAQRMMEYPFERCGVWVAFDVPAHFGADARACMKAWAKHSKQQWEMNKREGNKFQLRRIA
jgi:hypothetical protein